MKSNASCWMALALLLVSHAGHADFPSPREVVEARMKALNENDLQSFLALYAEDVEIFVYPDIPLSSGRDRLAEIFSPLFAAGDVAVVVESVIAVDSFVVVERTFSFGDVSEPGVAIYEVREGLIRSVSFVRDTRRAKTIQRANELQRGNRSP